MRRSTTRNTSVNYLDYELWYSWWWPSTLRNAQISICATSWLTLICFEYINYKSSQVIKYQEKFRMNLPCNKSFLWLEYVCLVVVFAVPLLQLRDECPYFLLHESAKGVKRKCKEAQLNVKICKCSQAKDEQYESVKYLRIIHYCCRT